MSFTYKFWRSKITEWLYLIISGFKNAHGKIPWPSCICKKIAKKNYQLSSLGPLVSAHASFRTRLCVELHEECVLNKGSCVRRCSYIFFLRRKTADKRLHPSADFQDLYSALYISRTSQAHNQRYEYRWRVLKVGDILGNQKCKRIDHVISLAIKSLLLANSPLHVLRIRKISFYRTRFGNLWVR